MKSLQLFFIDPKQRTVKPVVCNGELEDFYGLLGCRLIDVVCRQDNGDSLTIDDEGCYREDEPGGFYFNGEGPIVGPAIVTGVDRNGDTANPMYTVDEVTALIEWQDGVSVDPQIVVFSWC